MKDTRTRRRIRKQVKKATLYIGIAVALLTPFVILIATPSDYDECIKNGTDETICRELIDNQ